MPKIQCWIPSHVPGLWLTRLEILALKRSASENSQIYRELFSFWPRDANFNLASAARTTACLREKESSSGEHTCVLQY